MIAPAASAADPRGMIIVRVSEIFLKGRNRRDFARALASNARRLVAGIPGARVTPLYLRLRVDYPIAEEQACLDRLRRLFGAASMSPARPAGRTLEALAERAVAEADGLGPGSFKIETRRRDKRFPMTSLEISRAVGAEVVARTGRRVDVHHPDHLIELEIAEDQCFVWSQVVQGPGGLPVGTAGRVGLLLSGGIDSPVAGWSAMRRGCVVLPIYFHSFPYTGDKTKAKVIDLAGKLAAFQGPGRLWVVAFAETQKRLRAAGPAPYAVVLYRRMMMRVASRLTAADGGLALVTGENLGQVASQTLENLAAIEAAATLPVLRPLLTFDKLEIIELAQKVGTYELSILPYDDGCALFMPPHPVTRARLDDVVAAEASLDVDAIADELVASAAPIQI